MPLKIVGEGTEPIPPERKSAAPFAERRAKLSNRL
jgi:hypothetical protein